jgi:hypothetical protein
MTFSAAGTFITERGSFGTGDGQFNTPTFVATDCDGNVYVADYGNDRVQKFGDPDTQACGPGGGGAGDGGDAGPSTKPPEVAKPLPATPRDTTAPVITKPSLSSSVFAVNTRAGASAAKGSRLFLTLSEPATVVFVTEQRVGKRWRKVRIFGKRFPGGNNRLNYSGKIRPRGRQRALKPGRYRLRIRPSDRAGNRGRLTTVRFTIVRR